MVDILVCIGCLDVNDDVDVEVGFGQLCELFDLCCYYLVYEDCFVYLVFEVCVLGLSMQVVGEYVYYEVDIDVFDVLVDVLVLVFGGVVCSVVVIWLYWQFVVFVGINFEYMDYEESEYNVVLWVYYSDVELFGIEVQLYVVLLFVECVQGL